MKQKPKNQVENEMETTEMRMKFHRDHLEGKAKQNIGVHENARDEHVLLESTGIVELQFSVYFEIEHLMNTLFVM